MFSILLFLGNLSIASQVLLNVILTVRRASWYSSCHLSIISWLYNRCYVITGDHMDEILFHFLRDHRSSLYKLSQLLSSPPAVVSPVLQVDFFSPWDELAKGCLVWGHCTDTSPLQTDKGRGKILCWVHWIWFLNILQNASRVAQVQWNSGSQHVVSKPLLSLFKKSLIGNNSGLRQNKNQTEKKNPLL